MSTEGQIYIIKCIFTFRVYIGQTRIYRNQGSKQIEFNYLKRFQEHITESKNPEPRYRTKLNNAINYFGPENFKCKLIHECEVNELNYFEKLYIDQYDSYYNGYNSTLGGTGNRPIIFSKNYPKK